VGLAVALSLAQHGASLVIHSRLEQDAKDTLGKLPAARPDQFYLSVYADMARSDCGSEIATQLNGRIDSLDVVIHNAAILGAVAPLSECPVSDVDEALRINVLAPLAVTQALLPLIRNGRSPSIVFVSSGAGLRRTAPAASSVQTVGTYAISKFALEGLSNNLALELKSEGIRVNSVNPGPTRTRMRAAAVPQEDPMTLPTPEDIVPVFLHLARASDGPTNQFIQCRDWIGKDPFA